MTIIILLIVFCICLPVVIGLVTYMKTKPKRPLVSYKFSEPSKFIIEQYNKLPTENRPIADIRNILSALDTKYGIDKVNSNIKIYLIDKYPNHKHIATARRLYPEYFEYRIAIKELVDALAAQKYLLTIEGLGGSLDDAKSLANALRQERDLIHQVTNEMMK